MQAKAVTIKQFINWLQRNTKKTWYIRDIMKGGFGGGRNHTPLFKYITPHIDTRTMEIFSIDVEGSFPESRMNVNGCMEFNGTILELLESKFPDDFKEN
jgi:hypothetical protein